MQSVYVLVHSHRALFGTTKEIPNTRGQNCRPEPVQGTNSIEAAQCTSGALLTFDTDNIWNCWLPEAPREKKVLPAGS